MKIKSHSFEVLGGRTIKDGKSHWPNCLTLDISMREALRLIATLANGIQYREQKLQIAFMGKLTCDIKEE